MSFKAVTLKVNSNWKIGIVSSRFNRPITEKLEQGALSACERLGFKPEQVTCLSVPGAVEAPLAAKMLLEKGYDGVATLGAVIRGETTHYDYVCSSVQQGCTTLQLEYCKPVVFGVLTTENTEQALARTGGTKGHKGEEAIETLVEMLNIKEAL